jgi:hypothetical protein
VLHRTCKLAGPRHHTSRTAAHAESTGGRLCAYEQPLVGSLLLINATCALWPGYEGAAAKEPSALTGDVARGADKAAFPWACCQRW